MAPSPAQPYGNAAAQEDAGLKTAPLSDEAAYLAVLAQSWVDYAAVLESGAYGRHAVLNS